MKTPQLTLIAIVLCNSLFAQDNASITSATGDKKLVAGIYVSEKEFFERRPSILKSFKIVPVTDITFNEVTNKYDTSSPGITYQFLDSAKKPRSVYGFYDGKDMYMKNGKYFDKFDHVGRFSFITLKDPKTILIPLSIPAAILSIADMALATTKFRIYYYNKKNQLIEATNQSLQRFLSNDKDLANEFFHLKRHNRDILIKYLLLMNERYPE